jgi:hypothetical protein
MFTILALVCWLVAVIGLLLKQHSVWQIFISLSQLFVIISALNN